MAPEYEGFKENKMFEYVAVPKDRTPVEFKWVFRWNFNGEGKVFRAEDFRRVKASTFTKGIVQRLNLLRKTRLDDR